MSDLISRQALMKEFSDFVRESNNSDFAQTPTWNDAVSLVGSMPSAQQWIPCNTPPSDDRNVFIAHGTNNFKSCCIGHYDDSLKKWYEDRNWFACPIYDCKYWCDMPTLPDMGDNPFEPPKGDRE